MAQNKLRTRQNIRKTIVTLLIFIIPATISGCSRQSSAEALKDYELRCRKMSDDKLIIEFF